MIHKKILGKLLGGAAVLAIITYDTSMGVSVDANGYTFLPLRAGAVRYYVRNVGIVGNDGNAGTDPNAPLATLAAGIAKVVSGQGDQVLLAEGSTFAEAIPFLTAKSGFSPAYPTVIGSYDPADPTNEARIGMGHQRSARPILTGLSGQISNNVAPPSYVAIKGIDFNPPNVANIGIGIASMSDYFLIENNILRFTGFSFDSTEAETTLPTLNKLIYRNNSSYGQWNDTNGRTGGIYVSGINAVTVEDNTFYHSGWKVGASRDDHVSAGGLVFDNGDANVFAHPWYLQGNTNGIVRRNLVMDATDTATCRGDSDVNHNVYIRCPSGQGLGDGNSATDRPAGVLYDAGFNVMIAAINLNSTADRGAGFVTFNGKPGSRVHHNILIYSAVELTSVNAQAFGNAANANQPSYAEYDHNISAHWNASGSTAYAGGGTFPAQSHTSQENGVWDDPASGTMINRATAGFPNPLTEAQVYLAAGYADYNALVADAIAHPEKRLARTLCDIVQTAYGLVVPTDVTAPTLTLPTSNTTGSSTADIGVTTNDATGKLYYVVTTSAVAPHVSQIKFGMTAANVAATKAGSVAVASIGIKTFNLTGLTAGTYYAHFMHEDTSNNKSVAASSAAFTVVAATAVWNGSGGAPASSAAWTRSNGNLTATQTANDDTMAQLYASIAKAAGVAIVTITAQGTGSSIVFGGVYSGIPFTIGVDPGDGSETTYMGLHNGIGYRSDGTILMGGSVLTSGLATLDTGKALKIDKQATYIKFYVNNVLQYTFNGTDYTTSAIAGPAYIAATSIGSHDTALTLDASAW